MLEPTARPAAPGPGRPAPRVRGVRGVRGVRRVHRVRLALGAVPAPLGLTAIAVLAGACSGPDHGDAMVVREVVSELLVGEPAWEVLEARPDAPPRVDILTPSISWRVDGGDLPALVLPPPAAVELTVADGLGPVVLRASAGIDHAAHDERGLAEVGFRVRVNGEAVFDEVVPLPRDDKGKRNAWRHVGGELGIPLRSGDRVRLETLAPEGAPAVDAGFGGLWLETHRSRRRETASRERPNVVLVVMDTQREDRVGPGTTPNVEGLAERGTRFDEAWAASSWTWPSTASILTGLLPQRHGVLDYDSCYLGNALTTLPEVLQDAGYTTAAFSGNPLVTPDKNFGQGFETFRAVRRFEKTDAFLPEVLAWLEDHRDVRFFLYLQLVEPHMEYQPSESARAALGVEEPPDFPEGAIEDYAARLLSGEGRVAGGFDAGVVVPPAHRAHIDRLYDASVRTGDEQVGRVLDLLRELGLEETTVVAFTNDHGEELFDHELFEHGHSLHAELTRAPLVLAGPGVPAGRRVATPVSNRHLAPTLARLCGAELEEVDDALDLLAPFEERPVFLSTRHGWWDGWKNQPVRGVVKDGFVLHHAPTAGAFGAEEPTEGGVARLYDLQSDRGELHDLAAERPERVAELQSLIEERFEREALRRVSMPIPAGASTEQMLREIGYLGDSEDSDD